MQDLKFTEFKLLHDVMDDLCKKVTIKIPIEDVHEKSIENVLIPCSNNHKGKQSLKICNL